MKIYAAIIESGEYDEKDWILRYVGINSDNAKISLLNAQSEFFWNTLQHPKEGYIQIWEGGDIIAVKSVFIYESKKDEPC